MRNLPINYSACAVLFCIITVAFVSAPAHAIVNGKIVTVELFTADYPWVAAVIDPAANGICGGALIAPRWVITAAHCTAENKYVLLGSPDRSNAQRVNLQKVIRHPEFNEQTLQNDVGLLYLQEAVDIPVATLMSDAQSLELLRKGVPGFIFGWGSRPFEGVPGKELRYARTSQAAPQFRGSQIIRNDPDTGPCGSDSGGPLVLQTDAGETVLAGVVSATNGDLCASQGGIAIYTNLAEPAVRAFIDDMLQRFPADTAYLEAEVKP